MGTRLGSIRPPSYIRAFLKRDSELVDREIVLGNFFRRLHLRGV